MLHRLENLCGFFSSSGIARGFIFQDKNYALLGRFLGGLPQLFIHVRAMWLRVIKPPEIEAAHPVSTELFRQLNAFFQHLILLFESEVRVELVLLGTELR